MRGFVLALVMAVLPLAAGAQSAPPAPPSAQTLEDIRLNLQEIDAAVAALRAQLVQTGARVPATGGNPLQRLDALEAAIRQLTGRVEQVQNDVRRMAEDAGRRYADVEFRLSEIEGGTAALPPKPVPLGGGLTTDRPAATVTTATAVTEQNAYDAANRLLGEGKLPEAAAAFERFLGDFAGSPLTGEAQLGLATARLGLGAPREAARAYLAAYNAAPQGPAAPEALLGLANALQDLGQFLEACLTYAEVLNRFPGAAPDLLSQATTQRAAIGCR